MVLLKLLAAPTSHLWETEQAAAVCTQCIIDCFLSRIISWGNCFLPLILFCIIFGFLNEKMVNTKSHKFFSLERSGKLRPSMDLASYGLVSRHNGGLRKGQLIAAFINSLIGDNSFKTF